MSSTGDQIRISRPKRYDAALAQRAQELHAARRDHAGTYKHCAGRSKQRSLRQELGLSGSDCESETSSSSEGHPGVYVNANAILAEDYELLQQRYLAALEDVHRLGERERKAQESLQRVKQVCKSQSLVMRQSFRKKMHNSGRLIRQILHALQEVKAAHPAAVDAEALDEVVSAAERHSEEVEALKRAEVAMERQQEEEAREKGSGASDAVLKEQLQSLSDENVLLRRCIADLASGELAMLEPRRVEGDACRTSDEMELKEKYSKAVKVVKATKAKVAEITKEKEELLELLAEAKQRLDKESVAKSGAAVSNSAPVVAHAAPPVVPETSETSENSLEALVQEERQRRSIAEKQVMDLSARIKELSIISDQHKAHTAQEQSRLATLRANVVGSVQALKAGVASISTETRKDLDSFGESITQMVKPLVYRIRRSVIAAAEIGQRFEEQCKERKRLLNEVQSLRGNVRVLCRVRPVLASEVSHEVVVKYPGEDCIMLRNSKGREKRWEFNKVLPPAMTNKDIFENVSDLCTSVLDGYNVCIFAYGQTGSGKTYTMEGKPEDRGVNLRALEKLFADVSESQDSEIREVKVSVSFLEVYNEQIRDLLAEDGLSSGTKLEVKRGEHGMHVPNLAVIPVDSYEEVVALMRLGQQNRSVAATDMNAHSSRSHSMLSVYVTSHNQLTSEISRGKLHLIDLAGSERLAKSGAVGIRKTEAASINKSLSALGDVIHARANKSAHVPYRNSVLTYLLQDSLSNDSKTLMFVQISPVSTNAEESFCSLNFASRVQKVELGKASKHISKFT